VGDEQGGRLLGLQPRHDCSVRHVDHVEPGVVVHADVEIVACDLWVEALVAAKAELLLAAEIVGDEGEALRCA
jgi:hypothetical protein